MDFSFIKSSYTLTILATDAGGLQSTATVVIKVDDANDNSPAALNTPLIANIEEDAELFWNVLTVQSSDGDSGSNAQVR